MSYTATAGNRPTGACGAADSLGESGLSVRVLGVDPGLVRTGWALVTADGGSNTVPDHGLIAPATDAPLESRLGQGFVAFAAVLGEHQPDLVVLEDIFTAP